MKKDGEIESRGEIDKQRLIKNREREGKTNITLRRNIHINNER